MPGLESIVQAVAHLERRSAANNECDGAGTAVVGATIPSSSSPTTFTVSSKQQQQPPTQQQHSSTPRVVSMDGSERRVMLVPSPSPKVIYHGGYSRFLPYYEDHHPLVQERRPPPPQQQQEQQQINNQPSRGNPMLQGGDRQHHHRSWSGGGGSDTYQNLPPRLTQRFVSDHGVVIQVPPPIEAMTASHRARASPSSVGDDHPTAGGDEAALLGKPSTSPVVMEARESPLPPMVPPASFLKKAKKHGALSNGNLEGLISPAISTLLPRIAQITTDLDLYFSSMEQLCRACQQEHGKSLLVPDPNQPLDQVESNDVLLGRGGETNHHTGNVQYRMVVKASQPAYLYAKRRDKPRIAGAIVCVVRALRGRFLKKGESTNNWFDVGNTRAREKTSQALREGAPELRGVTKAASTEQTPERSDAENHPHHPHHIQGLIPHEHLPVVSGHHSPPPPHHHHHHHHPHEHQHHHTLYYVVPRPPPGSLRQQHQQHHDGPPAYYLGHPRYHPHHGFSVAAAPPEACMDYSTQMSLEQQQNSSFSVKHTSPHSENLARQHQHGDPKPAEVDDPPQPSNVAATISADVDSEEDRRNCAASPSSLTTTTTWSSSAPAVALAPERRGSDQKIARGPRVKLLKKRLEETPSE